MTLILRHMLRRLLVASAATAVTLAFVGVIVRSLGLFELLTHRVISLGDFFLSLLSATPMVFYLSAPLAAPAAIIYLYHYWNRDNQIVVLRCAGVRDSRIALPGVVVGILLLVFTASMSLYFVPRAIGTLTDIQYAVTTRLSLGLLEDGYLQRLEPKLSLSFRARPDVDLLNGVTILDGRQDDAFKYISAERGRILLASSGDGESRIVLEKGTYVLRRNGKDSFTPIGFDELLIPLGELDKVTKRAWRGFYEQDIGSLLHPPPDIAPGEIGSWKAEGYKRIATPLLALSYTLFALGALLRGKYARTRGSMIYTSAVAAVLSAWHILISVTPTFVATHLSMAAGYYALVALPGILGTAMLLVPPEWIRAVQPWRRERAVSAD